MNAQTIDYAKLQKQVDAHPYPYTTFASPSYKNVEALAKALNKKYEEQRTSEGDQ